MAEQLATVPARYFETRLGLPLTGCLSLRGSPASPFISTTIVENLPNSVDEVSGQYFRCLTCEEQHDSRPGAPLPPAHFGPVVAERVTSFQAGVVKHGSWHGSFTAELLTTSTTSRGKRRFVSLYFMLRPAQTVAYFRHAEDPMSLYPASCPHAAIPSSSHFRVPIIWWFC